MTKLDSLDIWSVQTDETLIEVRAGFLNDSLTLRGYNLPELPDSEVDSIYNQVIEAERKFSPDLSIAGYGVGSAAVADQLLLQDPETAQPTLLSAEHATDHIRLGERKEADWGVGGLSLVVGEHKAAIVLASLGRQTGDANYDEKHSFKEEISQIATNRQPKGFFSVHGMQGGLFGLRESRPYDILVGVGHNPNHQTIQVVNELKKYIDDLGLKVGVNSPFIKYRNGVPARSVDGKTLLTSTFAASKPTTTRAFVQNIEEEAGRIIPEAQIELSKSLRLIPAESSPDQKRKAERVYLGYQVISHLVELSAAGVQA